MTRIDNYNKIKLEKYMKTITKDKYKQIVSINDARINIFIYNNYIPNHCIVQKIRYHFYLP